MVYLAKGPKAVELAHFWNPRKPKNTNVPKKAQWGGFFCVFPILILKSSYQLCLQRHFHFQLPCNCLCFFLCVINFSLFLFWNFYMDHRFLLNSFVWLFYFIDYVFFFIFFSTLLRIITKRQTNKLCSPNSRERFVWVGVGLKSIRGWLYQD